MDTIGDFIIRLKNAGAVGHQTVSLPHSRLKEAVANKLRDAGYVTSVEVEGKGVKQTLIVGLKYEGGKHIINDVARVSKPGRRLYAKVEEIYPVKFGKGHLILSTPKGILTDREARESKVGGEQLFKIW
ncbi:30S ribosomal protein S8 [Candidatus Kaiserbacteria bacterium RIFCSPHIGHO2_01_FULL_46_22]|uniref:Small ribosomal subunit protein uS8 n=1 Tax=Candidatus Kaiserbacteria bacterium RIFCSPHIGHO2_01_FULL_46_22 TaxID=1798475 RepID=A0A1F6BX80_9BACT|nr:MAG: 30S ribosomal protein S8 [Candidatus Kaiserbacteria bacterium RIFCSPHIGHO2_01_FULL_46_22]